MASGWEALGAVLGGGIDRTGAFDQGRLRTAQTESAIQQARERQLSNIAAEAKAAAEERVRRTEAEAGIDSVPLSDLMTAGHANFDQVMSGRLKGQEYNFRSTLADPEAAGADRFLAGQGVQGKALNPIDAVGTAHYVDLRSDDPELITHDLGESMIDENVAQEAAANALAEQRARAPAAGAPDARVPLGYDLNPAYDSTKPTGDGNYKYIDARAPQTGSVEHRMNQRMVRSVSQLVPDLANLLTMPASASLGVIGTGTVPGANMLQASVDALRNTVTDDVARAYESQSAQIGRAMAFIESNGSPPNEALLADSIRSYSIRPGHTGFDVLRIFANLRQNIEQFNLVQQNDARVPADVRQLLGELTETTRRTVPFTVEQVNALQFGKGKYKTMTDLMRTYGFDPQPAPSAVPAAPGAAPAAPSAVPGANFPMKNARGWPKMKDAKGNYAYVGPNGEIEEIR